MNAPLPEDAVHSPCINVCRMDPISGLCEGCYRTIAEIARWGAASEADKRAILGWIAQRRAKDDDPWQGSLHGDCD
jgi:hypothetical protein